MLFSFGVQPARAAQAQKPAAIPSASPNGTKTPEEPKAPAATPVGSIDHAIPLPQIADRAQELDQLLQEISLQLTPTADLVEATKKADAQAEETRQRVFESRDLLNGAPTPLELEDEQRYWRSRSLEYASKRKELTELAAKLEEQIRMLEAQQFEWAATWAQIHTLSGIETVVERVRQELQAIQTTREQAQKQLNMVLTLQNLVSRQDQQISDILVRVRQVREQKRSRLLEPDSRPLWETREVRQFDQTVGPGFHHTFDRSLGSASEFMRAHKLGTFTLGLTYLLALLGTYRLRRYLSQHSATTPPPDALKILGAPFSIALLVSLLGTGKLVAAAPLGIAFFFYLLYLIPVLRLLVPLIEPKLRPLLYTLAIFYSLEGFYLLVQLPLLLRRESHALLIVAALVSFVWLGRPSRIGPLLMIQVRGPQTLVMLGFRAGLLLLLGSLLANVLGYLSLSQVLGLTALVGPFVGAALYCGARVLTLILSTVLGTHWVQDLPEARRDAVERWGGRILSVGAFLMWLIAMLQLLTIYESVIGALSALLRYQIGFEKVHFTLGGILTVLLILLLGYAFANFFTYFLQSFVLPKLPLKRGLPYAISTITYYLLLFVIALSALSAAGVELTKFTVLTGALGVGLGFGLQNIVNNFVSGVILLFERPIHVGDTIDVGGLVGIVRRIGARSSTVVTYQGAEVIVPNSNLLSNQVINWTLSSQWRRVDVPVAVTFGTDPERVIKLLVGVAEAHPGVLLARPPVAYFLGFGDSALNFELRFWCAQQDLWFQLRSDVTVAVVKALGEASIEVPFPQRDLHVRSIDPLAAESLANNVARSTSASEKSQRRDRG